MKAKKQEGWLLQNFKPMTDHEKEEIEYQREMKMKAIDEQIAVAQEQKRIQEESKSNYWTDESIQKRVDELRISDYFQTKVYSGRFVQSYITNRGTVHINLSPFQTLAAGADKLNIVRMDLSKESLCLLIKVFEHCVEQYGIDVRETLNKITNGKDIEFVKEFNLHMPE